VSDLHPSRRRAGLGLVGLALAGCSSGQVKPPILINLSDNPPPPAEPDAGATLGTGADLSGRVTAPVRVNGQGPFDFVIDTGANRTVVSSELAAALQLPDAGAASIHGIAGVEPARTALVRLLEVDAVASHGLQAPTLSRARLGADGLLGVDVLRGRRVTIDFRHDQLRIAPSRGAGPGPSAFDVRQAAAGRRDPELGEGVVVPARYRFGQLIIVAADVAGRPVTAFLDSGSQSTVANLALRRVAFGDDPDPRLRRYVASLLSATGQTAQGELGVIQQLRIGGLRIRQLSAVFADLHVFDIWQLTAIPSLLLGIDVLGQFGAVELDFGRRQVVFYPRRERPAEAP